MTDMFTPAQRKAITLLAQYHALFNVDVCLGDTVMAVHHAKYLLALQEATGVELVSAETLREMIAK